LKYRLLQIGTLEVCTGKVRPLEGCSGQICVNQASAPQHCAVQVAPPQVGCRGICTLKVCAAQISADQRGVLQLGCLEIGCGEIDASEFGPPEVGLGEIATRTMTSAGDLRQGGGIERANLAANGQERAQQQRAKQTCVHNITPGAATITSYTNFELTRFVVSKTKHFSRVRTEIEGQRVDAFGRASWEYNLRTVPRRKAGSLASHGLQDLENEKA
jgi:hypothetical protein